MNPQEQAWSGTFGDEYTARNRVDWRDRVPFWRAMINQTGARSVYEFGCNAGWNLSAIRRAYQDVELHGFDINAQAVDQARSAGLYGVSLTDMEGRCDLAVTVGVLIHVAPEHRKAVMERIVRASSDYVLAVEYAAHVETAIEYRGNKDLLWKCDYGGIYANMGLEMIQKGPAGKGFDNCTYWLLRKP